MTAGVAAAEVTFSGTAKFGYNDTDHELAHLLALLFRTLI